MMLKTKTFYVGVLCVLTGLALMMVTEGHKAEGAELMGLGLGLLGLRQAVQTTDARLKDVEAVARQIEMEVRRAK